MTEQGQGQAASAQGAPGGWSGRADRAGQPAPLVPGARRATEDPDAPDVLAEAAAWAMGRPGSDRWHADDDEPHGSLEAEGTLGVIAGESAHLAQLRIQTRQLLREFLRAVPRDEPDAPLALVRPDGSTRIFTRGELSAAIDRLRPRQRQIIRLATEERWPRQRVCEYLRHISLKTFERDQVEALDLLAQLE